MKLNDLIKRVEFLGADIEKTQTKGMDFLGEQHHERLVLSYRELLQDLKFEQMRRIKQSDLEKEGQIRMRDI